MNTENSVKVKISFIQEVKKVPVTPNKTSVEDVILYICKLLDIGPVARHLFALKDQGNSNWLLLPSPIETGKDVLYEFALRYNVPNIEKLRLVDENAYDFFFKQIRHGILHDEIPNLNYEKHKKEIMGLCVLDMLRSGIEDHISREDIKSNYKKYVPRWARKKHWIFLKTPILNKFKEIRSRAFDAHFVKSGYLDQFRSIVPNYLAEQYPCLLKSVNGLESDAAGIIIRVCPFDKEFPGISYKFENSEDVSILRFWW